MNDFSNGELSRVKAIAMASVMEVMAIQHRSIPNARDMEIFEVVTKALCQVQAATDAPQITAPAPEPTDMQRKLMEAVESATRTPEPTVVNLAAPQVTGDNAG